MEQFYRMKFYAPQIHNGVNTTIRRGKWLTLAKVGDQICMCDMGNIIVGFGRIQKIRHTKLSDVTQKEINVLACFVAEKTRKCLHETLDRIYRDFNPDKIAVVTFETITPPDKYDITDYGALTNNLACGMI